MDCGLAPVCVRHASRASRLDRELGADAGGNRSQLAEIEVSCRNSKSAGGIRSPLTEFEVIAAGIRSPLPEFEVIAAGIRSQLPEFEVSWQATYPPGLGCSQNRPLTTRG